MTEEVTELKAAAQTCPEWDEGTHAALALMANSPQPRGAAKLAGYVSSGPGWRVANEIDEMAKIAMQLPGVYCLGTLGNAAHATQGGYSDHNPIVKKDGVGIVRAIDFGGPMAMLHKMRDICWARYGAQDPAMYYYGYGKGLDDNQINNWGLPLGHHTDPGDAGHFHWSLNQKSYPSVAGGYVPAIDGRTGLGLAALIGGHTPDSPPAPPVPPVPGQVKAWQGYPVPGIIAKGTRNYFGDIDGNAHSLGGATGNPADRNTERGLVRVLQQRLIACGFVPGHTNVNDGWADGIFNAKDKLIGGPTTDAVTRFQKVHMPGTQFYGQVWFDDWIKLFNL